MHSEVCLANNDYTLVYKNSENKRNGEPVKLIALRNNDLGYKFLVYFYSTKTFEEHDIENFIINEKVYRPLVE